MAFGVKRVRAIEDIPINVMRKVTTLSGRAHASRVQVLPSTYVSWPLATTRYPHRRVSVKVNETIKAHDHCSPL